LLFADLQWANIETEWYRDEGQRYAVQDPRGFVRNTLGWELDTSLGLANLCEPRIVQMNPSHPEFKRLILEQLQHTVELGANGAQIDKVGGGGSVDYNPCAPLPPDRGVTQSVWETLRDFAVAARQVNPRFCLAAETHWDRAIPFVDVGYARFFSREHLPTTSYTFPEYKQTCCITGHYDFGMVNNCLRYGHVVNIEPLCLRGTAADAPLLATYIKEVLRLRRRLWETLWHSRVVEPLGVELDGDGGVLCGLHRSWTGTTSALVLNHFERQARRVEVDLPAEQVGTVTVHRPFARPVEERLPLEVRLEPDAVAVLTWTRPGGTT
jgi:hypothetical protein